MAILLDYLAASLLEVVSQTIRIKVSLDTAGLGALVRLICRISVSTQTFPSSVSDRARRRGNNDGFIEA